MRHFSERKINICPVCNKEFKIIITSKQKFCSKICFDINQKGKKLTKEHKTKIGLAQKGTKKQPLSEEHKQRLSSFRKGKPSPRKGVKLSNKTKQKISLAFKGKTYEELHGIEKANLIKEKQSIALKGKKHTDACKIKHRIKRIEQIEKNYGICYPNYNQKACEIFKSFDEINKTSGRYAMYGNGEYQIEELGYFPDYFNETLKIIIEIDENNHKYRKEKDLIRENEIKKFYPGFKFLRFKDTEMNEILNIKVGEKA